MTIIRSLERICFAIEWVAGILMALVTLLVVVSAVGRYLLSWPVPDAFDVSRLLLGCAIMWGFASVGYRGSHIKVDIVSELVGPTVRRWMDAFAWSVLLVFTILLSWKLMDRVQSAAASGEATMEMRIPAWPFYAIIWAGVAVSIVAVVARLVIVISGRGGLDHFDSADDIGPTGHE